MFDEESLRFVVFGGWALSQSC